MMSDNLKLGVIGGGGWLGGAIVASLLDTGLADPEHLTLSYRSERPDRFPGARWTRDNQQLADRSDIVIVSVRPADWPALAINAQGRLVISVMAGIRLQQLSDQLNTKRVVRALPNAAAEVGKSYTPWVASSDLNDRDRVAVQRIFAACGNADEVTSEAEIDYLTGLAGSGPAFPALLATAMMNDAIKRGFHPDVARRAVDAVIVGAGRLVELRDECPGDTVERFLSYQGTTAAAIEAMRSAGFDAAVRCGLAQALEKSVDMGNCPAS
jgi:pyrroline-5-carboxylate reductase